MQFFIKPHAANYTRQQKKGGAAHKTDCAAFLHRVSSASARDVKREISFMHKNTPSNEPAGLRPYKFQKIIKIALLHKITTDAMALPCIFLRWCLSMQLAGRACIIANKILPLLSLCGGFELQAQPVILSSELSN